MALEKSSRSLAPSRSRSSASRNPSRVNVQTLSRRTNARNSVSRACDGQVGRKPRLPNIQRTAVFQNHQLASCISQVVLKVCAVFVANLRQTRMRWMSDQVRARKVTTTEHQTDYKRACNN